MQSYKVVNELPHQQWSDFLASQTGVSVFQTPEMLQVFSKTKYFSPFLVALVDHQNEILGTVVAAVITNFSGVLGSFTARSIVWGGPVVKESNSQILDALLQAYQAAVKSKAIYSEFRNDLGFEEFKQTYEDQGLKFEDHLNIIVDLTKSEDELWKDVKSSGRYKIKKARKEGTTFKVLESPEEIRETYKILQEVYHYAKLPLPDQSLFEAAAEELREKNMIRFFGAMNEGKLIGTRIALCYKDRLFDWYAGSYRAHYKKLPNDLLPWEVFLWGKENGYKYFDFGGAGKPNEPYGVRDFKLKFSKELVNPGRYAKIHKPLLMQLGRLGLKVFKLIKS